MKVSKHGLVEIASHEAIVPYVYHDSIRNRRWPTGVPTWGVGHAKVSGRAPHFGTDLKYGVEYPLEYVFEVFRDDIAAFEKDVNRIIKVPLAQHEFDALTSFHYNTGKWLHRATFTKSLNAGKRELAAKQIMRFRKPPEIIGRREKEQRLFRDGVYSSGGKATIYKASKSGKVLWHTAKRVNVMKLLGDDQSEQPITAILSVSHVYSDDVRRMQEVLGIYADGIFGPITKMAVEDYQREHSLLVDGIAGKQTLGHMGLA